MALRGFGKSFAVWSSNFIGSFRKILDKYYALFMFKFRLQVLKRIKAKYPKTQVILTTGENSLKATLETHKHGAFTHVIKPTHLDKLVLILKRALGKNKGFHTKSAKEVAEDGKELLEHFHDETVITVDALLAILN
jgi:DNA-binding NarL/FixJ family response regulator